MTSTGDGHDKDDDLVGRHKDNVIPLKIPRKKKSVWGGDKKPNTPPPQKNNTEPFINIPPYTKFILLVMIGIHLVMTYILPEEQAHWIFIHLGFIPGRFTGNALFEPLALITPFTYIFIHGSWLHIAMNGVMLLAFGAGVEKWMGGKKMIAFFILCSLFGVLTHFALNYNSYQPVVGASGGLSGLFAAALVMLNRRHAGMTGRYGFLPLIAVWVGVTIIFGMMGTPDGGDIAWAAHIGGFLGGFLVLKWMKL